MTIERKSSPFQQGFREGAPFLLVVGPFAVLFGVVATEAGLNVIETLAFSLVVVAGAAQFTALQLLVEQAPALIAILSALAVNLRMAMYSASLTPWLGPAPLWKRALIAYTTLDQTFVVSLAKFEAEGDAWDVAARTGFFFGVAAVIVPPWMALTVVGTKIGQDLPAWLPLDFAVPITFLAMIAPALRTRAHVIAALSGALVAMLAAALPYNLGLLAGGLAGMAAGAEIERRQQERHA